MGKKFKGFGLNNKIKQSQNTIDIEDLITLFENGYTDEVYEETIEDVDEKSQKPTQSEISDNTYQDIAKRVVDITEKNLREQEDKKDALRKPLQNFIVAILSIQFVVLVFLMCLNDFCFHLEADIIKTYIASVFAETLLGLTIMISFAFSSKETVQLIKILNAVISDFKVYGSENSKNKKNKDG